MLFGEGGGSASRIPQRPAGREAAPKHQRPDASTGSKQGEEKAFLAARRCAWAAPVNCGKSLCSQGFFATTPCSRGARNCIADNQATIQIRKRHSQRIEEGNPRNVGVGGSRRNYGGMPSEPPG